MFDIGFTEILVIATITLIVIGPERLPETVRTVSLWIGRLKRSLRETRREIEQQIGADDIRRELHNEEVMRSLEKIRTDVSDTLNKETTLEGDLYPTSRSSQEPEKEGSEQGSAALDSGKSAESSTPAMPRQEAQPESEPTPKQEEEQKPRDPSAGSSGQ